MNNKRRMERQSDGQEAQSRDGESKNSDNYFNSIQIATTGTALGFWEETSGNKDQLFGHLASIGL